MINEYYILKHGNQEGPYTHTQLMDMDIGATDFLISPLADGMQQATDLPEFQEYFISMGIYTPTAQNVASFWWRLLAYLIDCALLFAVVGFLASAVGITSRFTQISIHPNMKEYELSLRVALWTIMRIYHSVFESTTMQGSIGKFICKLAVVDASGQKLNIGTALVRNFSKIISILLCGFGFLTVLWNPMKQAWHDQVAKTYVIKKGQ